MVYIVFYILYRIQYPKRDTVIQPCITAQTGYSVSVSDKQLGLRHAYNDTSHTRVQLIKVNAEYRGLGGCGAPTPLLKVRAGRPYQARTNTGQTAVTPSRHRE